MKQFENTCLLRQNFKDHKMKNKPKKRVTVYKMFWSF